MVSTDGRHLYFTLLSFSLNLLPNCTPFILEASSSFIFLNNSSNCFFLTTIFTILRLETSSTKIIGGIGLMGLLPALPLIRGKAELTGTGKTLAQCLSFLNSRFLLERGALSPFSNLATKRRGYEPWPFSFLLVDNTTWMQFPIVIFSWKLLILERKYQQHYIEFGVSLQRYSFVWHQGNVQSCRPYIVKYFYIKVLN